MTPYESHTWMTINIRDATKFNTMYHKICVCCGLRDTAYTYMSCEERLVHLVSIRLLGVFHMGMDERIWIRRELCFEVELADA